MTQIEATAVVDQVEGLPGPFTAPQPPSMEEYRRQLEATTILGGCGKEFKAMVQFAAWTGIRKGELFALQREDLSDDEVTIRQSRKLSSTGRPDPTQPCAPAGSSSMRNGG